MSEQPVHVAEHWRGGGPGAGAAPPPGDGGAPPDGGGGGFMSARWGPLPVWGWAVLAGGLALGAFFWLRKGKQGAAAASQAQPAATAATGGPCYDSAGNSVPCGQADYASQIADLQAEIDNLQGTGSTPISTGGAGSTTQVSVPDVIGDSTVQARAVLQAAGLWSTVQGGPRGTVTAQSPSAGTVTEIGTMVTLTTTSSAGATTQTPRTLPRQTQVTLPASG